VYIGFESVNPDALEAYRKQQTVEQIAESIRAFHAYNIWVHGMFVLGSDADTLETTKATVDFAIKHQIDTVQFMTLTPLPGTDFYYRMKAEGRIISDDWTLYDGHHALVEPAHMSAYALQRASLQAMLRFYAPRRAWGMLVRNACSCASSGCASPCRAWRSSRSGPGNGWRYRPCSLRRWTSPAGSVCSGSF